MPKQESEYDKIKNQERNFVHKVIALTAIILLICFVVLFTTFYSDSSIVVIALVYPAIGSVMYGVITSHIHPDGKKNIFSESPVERSLFFYQKISQITQMINIVFLIVTILGLIMFYVVIAPQTSNITSKYVNDIINGIILMFAVFVYGLFGSQLHFRSYGDFYFDYAKSCFDVIAKHKELPTIEKSKMIQLGLSKFDNYLKKKIKRRITNLDIFYLKILSDSEKSMIDNLDEIQIKFNESDKLSFLRYLGSLYGHTKLDFLSKKEYHSILFKILTIAIPPIVTISLYIISYVFGINFK
jgi:hypothetical protein